MWALRWAKRQEVASPHPEGFIVQWLQWWGFCLSRPGLKLVAMLPASGVAQFTFLIASLYSVSWFEKRGRSYILLRAEEDTVPLPLMTTSTPGYIRLYDGCCYAQLRIESKLKTSLGYLKWWHTIHEFYPHERPSLDFIRVLLLPAIRVTNPKEGTKNRLEWAQDMTRSRCLDRKEWEVRPF